MNHAVIRLTQHKEAIVDIQDAGWLNEYSWCYDKTNGYALRAFYQKTSCGSKYTKVYMHRAILERQGISVDGLETDHRNRNRLDNRRVNLRPATSSQNKRNCTKQKNASSKYLGVHWYKPYKKWMAKITDPSGQSVFLGYFECEAEAAGAHDRAALEHHNDFASLNFPEGEAQ